MHILYRPFPIEGTLIKFYKDPAPSVSKDSDHDEKHSRSESERMMASEKAAALSKEELHSNLS